MVILMYYTTKKIPLQISFSSIIEIQKHTIPYRKPQFFRVFDKVSEYFYYFCINFKKIAKVAEFKITELVRITKDE